MRQTLRVLGFSFWSLLSLDIVIGLLDYFARWEVVRTLMNSHPLIAAFVRTPLIYALFLAVGFLFLYAERRLKLPKILGRYTNSRILPNLKTTSMQLVLDSETKRPGWDEKDVDWRWLVEIQLANDSETPTTIEEVEVNCKARGKIKHLPFGRKTLPATYKEDLSKFHIDDNALPSLMDKIRGVPLTKGIGHRGWLRVDVKATQKEINGSPVLDVWLVDALRGKHRINYERNSDKRWNKEAFVVEHFMD